MSITPTITLSRSSSGKAPYGFTATAYGTTASGMADADEAFLKLDYVWVLSLNGATQSNGSTQFTYGNRTGNHPTLGYTSRQLGFGPNFSRIIDPPFGEGNVSATLTLYASRVSGGVTESANTSVTLSVEDQATAYASFVAIGQSVAPTAGTGGIPIGATCIAESNWGTIVSTYLNAGGSSPLCVMLVGGDTFTGASNSITPAGIRLVRACGTGMPIITGSSANSGILKLKNTVTNLTFSDIDLDGASTTTYGGVIAETCTQTDVALLRCHIHDLGFGFDGFETYFSVKPTGFYMQDCNVELMRSTGGSTPPIGFRWCSEYMGIVGNRIWVTAINSTEHPWRTHWGKWCAWTNNTVGHHTSKEQMSLRALDAAAPSWGLSAADCATRYNNIQENAVTDGTGAGIQFTFSSGGDRDERYNYNIVNANYVVSTSGKGSPVWLRGDHNKATNNAWQTATNPFYVGIFFSPAQVSFPAATNNCYAYHNSGYSASSDTDTIAAITNQGTSTNEAVNNIAYGPSDTISTMLNGTYAVSTPNSSTAQLRGTSPNYTTTPPAAFADFQITTSSYAKAAGTQVTVYRDGLGRWRHETTIDMGAFAFNLGTDPVPASGQSAGPSGRITNYLWLR